MQQFKIEHFKEAWPDRVFPEFRSLNDNELLIVQYRLMDRLEIRNQNDLLNLVKIVQSISSVIDGINVEDDEFGLLVLLTSLDIEPKDYVYVNWYRYDDVDEISIYDLNAYFSDIWYSGSDDIDILDDTYSWILSVRHDGVPSVAKLA